MKKYIHQQPDWPIFSWSTSTLARKLAAVHQHQGSLRGRMETLGFNLRSEAILRTLTLDVLKNSEIENEILNPEQVRSSIARRLGMDVGGLVPADRNVEGVVEMMLDATQHFDQPLTQERLFDWHAALFPTGRSGMQVIIVGYWRTGPMQVVSGAYGRERVHFEAPEPAHIEREMNRFLDWYNHEHAIDPVLKAAMAHLWFVTIHPFDDGNGRIARTIADMQLARADNSSQRFYSMSAQIRTTRSSYYDCLEKTQTGTLDITGWLEWFLTCLDNALDASENTLSDVMHKAQFWEGHAMSIFNARQQLMINKLLDGFIGKLTSSKWAKITKCSQDTALRDIQDLLERKVLIKDVAGGRSSNYLLQHN